MNAIDGSVLEELLQVMGEDLAALVVAFENDSLQRLSLIEAAAARGEADTVRSLAHTLKGGALGMGANSFARYCRGIELCGREAALANVDTELANARRSLREALSAINGWLSAQGCQKNDSLRFSK